MSRRLTAPGRMAGTLFIGLALAACSKDKGGGPPPEKGSARPAAAPSAGAGAANRCPLTAEQVSAAVGAPVKGPDSSCSFFHAEKIVPSATFVNQLAMACSGTMPAETGYTEKVEGLGTTAYVNEQADGSWILVCRSGAPFEIRVDAGGKEAARAAATALARQVLGAR